MARVTYYDYICGCYKLKDDVSTNIIQRMGRIEDAIENYINIADLPFQGNDSEMITDRLEAIVNAFENAQERF